VTLSLRLQSTNRSFERLYRAHVGDVYRYALAITGNTADAEDVAQTTFMNAYRALERGERPEKPRHWLIAIAHNVCRQRFRQSARRPMEVTYFEDVAETLVPSDDTPTAADIQRALGELALNQREALVMRELEGRSYADIAELLGISIAAVETLLFRARRALREQLEGALSCSEAEAALSLQLDGRLSRSDAAPLRSHLRSCETCRRLARRQRAQRKSVRALAVVPLPQGLASLFGSGASGLGAAGLGAAVATKVAAVTVAAVVVGGGGYAIVKHETASTHPAAARAGHAGSSASAKVVAQEHATRTQKNGTGTSSRRGSRGRSAGHAVRSSAAGSVAGTGSIQHAIHPAHPASGHTVTHTSAASTHAGSTSSKRALHAPAKHAAKPVARTARHSHTAVFPASSRSCRPNALPTVTDAVTTTPVVTTTAATSLLNACAKPQGRGKGSATQP
jgi:RNA polymerase sigma factor (sigma-70 family)